MNQGLDFQVPPNITVTRQRLPNGIGYVFRDAELGEIGRLAVEGTPAGETQITSEVAGDPSDPMTQRRLEMFGPLSQELTGILELMRGRGREAPLPVRKPQPVGEVPCEEVRCETCGRMVAFLVFADEATNAGIFEDYARLMYPHYARHDVPTYIIGPENLEAAQWSTVEPTFSKYGRTEARWNAFAQMNLTRAFWG
jgi:hypothetical protein